MNHILKKQNRRTSANIAAALLISILCYVLFVFTHKLYADVDGYMISIVTNRIFNSENYCMFLHSWLCRIVGELSDLFMKADALALLEHTLFFAEFCLLFFVVFSSGRNILEKIFFVLLLIQFSQITGCWNANFTVQAAAYTAGGIVLIYVGDSRKRKFLKASGFIFCAFGIMLRLESALFFVPFVLLDIAVDLFSSQKGTNVSAKELMHLWLMPTVIFAVLIGTRFMYNTSAEYRQSVEYSKLRAAIVDYQYKPWEEVQSSMPEVTKTEYEAVCNWNFSDTVNINIEKLSSIARHGKKVPFPMSVKGLTDVVPWMFFLFRGSPKTVKYLAVIIAVLWSLILISGVPAPKKIESALAILGAAVILWYFIFVGRAPFRIWEAVFLAVIALFMIILSRGGKQSGLFKMMIVVGIMIGAVNLFFDLKSLEIVRPQLPIHSREYDVSLEYDNDKIYIWNEDPSSDFKESGKLPTRDFLSHNIVEGDWIYGQVYFIKFLEASGIPNPAKALAMNDNTYYVAEDCRIMLDYLKEHFDESLNAIQTGEIHGFPVWQFY